MEDDIDRVMHMTPLELRQNEQDLLTLIAYLRKQRENFDEKGTRPKKEVTDAPITLESLKLAKPKVVKPMRRF